MDTLIEDMIRRNVLNTVESISRQSEGIRRYVTEGRVMVIGALYDVTTGQITILSDDPPAVGSGRRSAAHDQR